MRKFRRMISVGYGKMRAKIVKQVIKAMKDVNQKLVNNRRQREIELQKQLELK